MCLTAVPEASAPHSTLPSKEMCDLVSVGMAFGLTSPVPRLVFGTSPVPHTLLWAGTHT